ncbi:MAG: transglutaminase domain-containing protein, partial [bacterium]
NAQKIYEIAPYLQYVQLIDHGSYPEEPNYYTTVRYRIIDGGDTIWTDEYPKEIYYWFIVHPKLSDEKVKMNDSDGDTRQRTYGYFWREYLLYNPSSTRPYTTDDSLVLANVLQLPTYLWTRSDTSFPPARPFRPNDSALDIIGNWVSKILPYGAAAPRPIQPNQIAYSHHGYCGEVQDLLAAATRCALIPCASTMDPAEDHVWNEFYDNGWEYYQVDREGGGTSMGYDGGRQDVDYGGGKNISMIWNYWGNGYVEDVSDRYSQVCTLQVNVRDEFGFPVDGALIIVATEGFYDSTTLDIAGCAFTNRFGQAKFVVGDRRNFYIRAESSIGNYPSTGGVILVARATVAGRVYSSNVTIRAHVPFIPVESELTPPESLVAGYAITVDYHVPCEYIVQNNSYFDSEGSEFRWLSYGGAVAFFICDSVNYELFVSSRPFRAYMFEELTTDGEVEFYLPDTLQPWYVVFSTRNMLRHIQKIEYTAKLVQPGTGISSGIVRPVVPSTRAYPNPFNPMINFDIISDKSGVCRIEIYDLNGYLVQTEMINIAHEYERYRYTWDGNDLGGRDLPSGLYFAKISINGKMIGTHKIVMLK